MIRRKMKKNFYLMIFLICIFSISTGYALLNSTLIIMGTSAIQKNTWDIHFENLNVTKGSVTATSEPRITNSNRISDFTFVLDKRGDFYEFTVDIVNSGSLDAMIDSVEKTPALTIEQQKYLSYTITYQNNEEINKNQLIKSNDFIKIKVRVEFKSNITASDLPQTQQILNLGFHINYIQAEDNGTHVDNNGKLIKVVSGTGTNIGDEVCFGKECFYVISSTYEKITMLAKYNLYVGGVYNSGWTAYGEEATGKQNHEMKGYIVGQKFRNGITKFSDTNYWSSTVSNYPAYVYNENSLLYGYVENYKSYLSTLGVISLDARLITKEELEELGCSGDVCSFAPSWIYATSYWSGTADTSYDVCGVSSENNFFNNFYEFDNYFGVRPVIEIDRSILPVEPVTPVANGSLDAIGTIVTIGTEQFYTIGIEGENVKLLSMMNITLDENPSQSSDENSTVFSDVGTDYSGSIVEGYVNNYKNTLELTYGIEITSTRLITLDELRDEDTFACEWDGSCPDIYPWIYSTSYWTETRDTGDYILGIFSHNLLIGQAYYEDNQLGVRPVIVIPKSTVVLK